MIEGLINKIIPFSAVDGPGNRMTIFLQGCNFNCVYCHNPETIKQCKQCGKCVDLCANGALSQVEGQVKWEKEKCTECGTCTTTCTNSSSPRTMRLTASQIIEGIKPYKHFIDGLTVSGGECTLQKEFLLELFRAAKAEGLSCMMDSNGSCDLSQEAELLELCEGVMLDVKAYDEEIHKQYMEMTNQVVLKNLEHLASCGKLYEVRTVVVPNLFDNEETVREVSRVLSKYNGSITYKLIAFRSIGVKHIQTLMNSPSQTYMERLKAIAIEEGVREVVIVGH